MSPSTSSAPGTLAPGGSAAPLVRQVLAQASMEARLLLRNGEQLLLALVIPVLVLVAGVVAAERVGLDLGGSPGRVVDVLTPGVIALAVMSSAFTSLAIATGFERRYGVIKWLGSSPLPRHGLLLGKVLALLLVEALQLAVVALVGALLGWSPTVAPGTLLLTLVLGTAAFAALGLLVAGTLRAEATLAAANLVYLLLLVGGAVVVPADQYGVLGEVARLLPSGALGEATRAALGAGGDGVPWAPLGVLLAWAVVGGTLTARTFRWE